MSGPGSVRGIGGGILHPVTLRLSGAAKPKDEDLAAAQAAQAKQPKGIGKPNPLDGIKAKADAAASGNEKGSTGNSTLDALQKAIDMAKRQLELAQKQLRAVEAQSKGASEEDRDASQAAREAAQANVTAASEALMNAYAAYTEALKKAGGNSGGVSAKA